MEWSVTTILDAPTDAGGHAKPGAYHSLIYVLPIQPACQPASHPALREHCAHECQRTAEQYHIQRASEPASQPARQTCGSIVMFAYSHICVCACVYKVRIYNIAIAYELCVCIVQLTRYECIVCTRLALVVRSICRLPPLCVCVVYVCTDPSVPCAIWYRSYVSIYRAHNTMRSSHNGKKLFIIIIIIVRRDAERAIIRIFSYYYTSITHSFICLCISAHMN